MEYVRAVGRGFFPLDEELGLLPGVLTPHGHECLVRLAGWVPFEKAAEMFGDFMGIDVSKGLSQRYAEAAGAEYEQMQAEAVAQLEQEVPTVEQSAERLQVSADGAMVPLLHGVWAEVKTLVIGAVNAKAGKEGEQIVQTSHLSYFSRKASAEQFQRLALVEMYRRGVEKAREVAAIMDGAEWLQGFTDYHCPQATRILDFPHAAEHLNQIGEYLHGEHTPESHAWLSERLHRLKHAGPNELLAEFEGLQTQHPEVPAIVGNVAYLLKRKSQLQYPTFQAQGWPIGSGIVESGNKVVVEARLKGAGMHWHETHVNPMLTLRNILCSDRWKEEWPQIEARLRQQTRLRRQKLHRSRCPATPTPAVTPTVPRLDERVAQSLQRRLAQPAEPRQPQPNPWRNFKFGKNLYQPSQHPKN